MSTAVIVGAQWGDEGKGKVVDLVTEAADMVVRYAGGPNAGHTLVVGGQKIVVRLVPSGILQPHSMCVMGQGMVVDLEVLFAEIDALEARGVRTGGRIVLSDRAHVILPYHLQIDGLREAGPKKIGTTKKGIGPCYEDKVARRGLRVADLAEPSRIASIVEAALAAWAPVVRALGGEPLGVDAVVRSIDGFRKRALGLMADASVIVDGAIRSKKNVLFEGAQGTLLDVDHGTYPFVTSSPAVAGGACTGSGIGPSRIQHVMGITKAYATRVGEGPFPTELNDDIGERIRQSGGEFGSVTGRPRRVGWLDIPLLRYAARVNGIDAWAITKLDVLTGLDEIRVAHAYGSPAGETLDVPAFGLDAVVPLYRTFEGWTTPLSAARTIDALPASARAIVRFIEEATGVPAHIVSVGQERADTIIVEDVFRR